MEKREVQRWRLEPLAGGKRGNTNGKGKAASFNFPRGVTVDSKGLIYVADSGNRCIRVLDLEGNVKTLDVKNSQFSLPCGVSAAQPDLLWVTDALDHKVSCINLKDQTLSSLEYSHFNAPQAVAYFKNQLIVADSGNKRVLKIDPEKPSSVIPITGSNNLNLNCPRSLAVDDQGWIYVCDCDNSNNKIIRISPQNEAENYSGQQSPGFVDGEAYSSKYNQPSGLVVVTEKHGPGSYLYIVDTKNKAIRKIDKKANVSTVIYEIDSTCDNQKVNVFKPVSIACHPCGSMIIVDSENHTVYLLVPTVNVAVEYEPFSVIPLALTNVSNVIDQIKDCLKIDKDAPVKVMIKDPSANTHKVEFTNMIHINPHVIIEPGIVHNPRNPLSISGGGSNAGALKKKK